MKFEILKIDLSKQKSRIKELPKSLLEKWIGGRGLGAELLSKEIHDPYSAKNSIFITTGAVSGTTLPTSSRISVQSISPLTGFYLCSNAGGHFAARLRSQGLFGIQITGKSKTPTYVSIIDGKISFHDAKGIWGLTTEETIKALAKEKNMSLALIGQAGENLVRFASLQFDMRSAGRGGAGAIFGYKKLKAILVNHGNKLEVGDKEKMKRLAKLIISKKGFLSGRLSEFGTPGIVDYSNKIRTFPVDNYRDNHDPKSRRINGNAVKKITENTWGCWSCPVRCGRITKSQKYDVKIEGPEYESIWSLGGDCGNYDLDVIIKANKLCDDYGLDTISTGAVIAWFRECCQKGLVKETWTGNEMILDLIEKITFRKGVGNLLAEGSFKASKKIPGSEEFLSGSKGLEAPAWDPRASWSTALCYATSPTGADHRKGRPVERDLKSGRPLSTIGKAKIAIEDQDWRALIDSSGFCGFIDDYLDYKILVQSFKAILGISVDEDDLKRLGGRIINKEREINIKRGLTNDNDTLSERLLNYPVRIYLKKSLIGKENLERMKKEYYQLRGWSN